MIPFVGAGLSMPFGFPSWGNFLIETARPVRSVTAIRERLRRFDYEAAAEDLLDCAGSFTFNQVLEDTFGDHRLPSGPFAGAVSVLPRFATGPVLTTNFDHLLELAFERAGKRFDQVVWGARTALLVGALQQQRPYLLKLHGDVLDSEDRVLTRSDYERAYGNLAATKIDGTLPLPKSLRFALSMRPLVFLGWSLQQDRTLRILEQVVDDTPGIAHFALLERPLTRRQLLERRRFLGNCGIRPIWFPVKGFGYIELILEWLLDSSRVDFVSLPSGAPSRKRNRMPDPSTLPDKRRLPYPSLGIRFIGREEYLWSVHDMLHKGKTAIVRGVGQITGTGGLGKTQLATEYAHRFASEYQGGIFWVDADRGRAVMLRQVAEAAGLDFGERLSEQERLEALWNALSRLPGVLIVLDNFLEDEELNSWLPPYGPIHVLVTTRRRDLGAHHRSIDLDFLNDRESLGLLNSGRRQHEASEAHALIQLLGGLPLALELVRSFLDQRAD